MRKVIVLLVVALSFIGVATKDAGAIGVYGIWWMPDEGDEDGWGIGLKEKRTLTPLFALDGRVSYVKFSGDLDTAIIPLELTACLKLGMIYAGIGGGYYIFTGDAELENTFGYYALLGIEVLPGPVTVFGELKWQFLEPEFDTTFGGDADLESIVIHAGVTFGLLH